MVLRSTFQSDWCAGCLSSGAARRARGIILQHGLLSHRGEQVKLLKAQDGRSELRAVTCPDYGRIWDHELVAAVMKIAGNGVSDTRWKAPGVLDWRSMRYNPYDDVTRETTTLNPSDRAFFLIHSPGQMKGAA